MKPPRRSPQGRPRSRSTGRAVAAADFKARCLELIDQVRETGAEYIVTKHGRPVVRVVAYRASGLPSGFGAMKGTVLQYDRPLDPVDGDYDVNRD